ncbi:MAG: tRNA glutamyl-Q(34) synthetase GluQRS [Oscillospiraceae bacterium]
MAKELIVGRFAPSPSGRMHLGNVFTAFLAYASAKSQGGKFLLRIEDLDTVRCKREYAEQMMDDLHWLGIDWDEAPLWQSERTSIYEEALQKLRAEHLAYPCTCSRAERRGTPSEASAPHSAAYARPCPCRYRTEQQKQAVLDSGVPVTWRFEAPDMTVNFTDGHYGPQSQNLAKDWGDVVLRRSDGMFAYQLAVSVDDCASGVTEIVRGRDLLSSAGGQKFLGKKLNSRDVKYFHTPLLLAPDGHRLSKREKDLDFSALKNRYSAPELLGLLDNLACHQRQVKTSNWDEILQNFDFKSVSNDDLVLNSIFFN